MVAINSNINKKKKNTICLKWCHQSVRMTRQSNLSQNGDVSTMFFSQNIYHSPPRQELEVEPAILVSANMNVDPVQEATVNILAKEIMMLKSSF